MLWIKTKKKELLIEGTMFLPTFNLKTFIELENKNSGSKISDSESFGFIYFNSELLALMNQEIEIINANETMYVFSEEEASFQRSVKKGMVATVINLPSIIKERKRTKLQTSLFTSMVPKTESEIESHIQSINKKQEWINWVKTQAVLLRSSTTWQVASSVPNIENIKNDWDKHKDIAHWTDTAVYKIASEILPWLIKRHKKALRELLKDNHRIPNSIYNKYIQYLKDFISKSREFQQLLVHSMLARLQALDDQDNKNSYTSPVLHVSRKLNIPGCDKKQPFQVVDTEINYFRHYIEKNGSQSARKQLYKLSCFHRQDILTTSVVDSKEYGKLLIPNDFVDSVPTQSRWPHWLFRGHNFRHAFFNDYFYLLSRLKKQSNIKQHYIDPQLPTSYLPLLAGLNQTQELLNKSLNDVSTQSLNLPWFSFGTKAFLSRWNQSLTAHKLKVIEDKLFIAEQLATNLVSEPSSTHIEASIPWNTCKHLFDLTSELSSFAHTESLHPNIKYRINAVKNIATKFESVNKFFHLIGELAKGVIITQSEKDYLASYIDRMKTRNDSSFDNIRVICKKQLDDIFNNLIIELKSDPFKLQSQKDLENHQKRILCYLCIVQRIGSQEQFKTVELKARKYFLRYLQNLLLHFDDKHENHVITGHEVLRNIGNLANWIDFPLITHLDELLKLRNNDEVFFKIKCKSLVIALVQEFLQKRVFKELTQFDAALFNTLKSAPYNYSDNTILEIIRIRDEMILTGKSIREATVTLAEKSIVGLNSESTYISDAIDLSVSAHKTAKCLTDESIPLSKRPLEIYKLGRNIAHLFKTKPELQMPARVRDKPWFCKKYLVDDILVSPEARQNNRI